MWQSYLLSVAYQLLTYERAYTEFSLMYELSGEKKIRDNFKARAIDTPHKIIHLKTMSKRANVMKENKLSLCGISHNMIAA